MFSLLAIVVTLLVLGSVLLWRAVRAAARAVARSRSRRAREVTGGSALERGGLQTVPSADATVAARARACRAAGEAAPTLERLPFAAGRLDSRLDRAPGQTPPGRITRQSSRAG